MYVFLMIGKAFIELNWNEVNLIEFIRLSELDRELLSVFDLFLFMMLSDV